MSMLEMRPDFITEHNEIAIVEAIRACLVISDTPKEVQPTKPTGSARWILKAIVSKVSRITKTVSHR